MPPGIFAHSPSVPLPASLNKCTNLHVYGNTMWAGFLSYTQLQYSSLHHILIPYFCQCSWPVYFAYNFCIKYTQFLERKVCHNHTKQTEKFLAAMEFHIPQMAGNIFSS